MSGQLKKIFSIALALIVGVGIVFFAWKSGTPNNRVSFEPTISGGSWKDSLLAIPGSHSLKITAGTENTSRPLATTTTAILAREMLLDYGLVMQSRATTTLNDTDAQALAQMLVERIQLPKGTIYSAKDLNILNDNSDAALTVYANKIGEITQAFATAHTKNELTIVTDALSSKDASKLQELKTIAGQYAGLQKSLLATPVPSIISSLHLRLAQSYANIETMVIAMQSMLSDPVLGISAFNQYKKEIDALDAIAVEYRDYTPAR